MANDRLLTFEDIFDGRFLRIPDYQRGYAWEENQLKDFWEDLENLEEEHSHYTGVLTLEKVTKQKKDENPDWIRDYGAYDSDKSFYVVDGQQRITTSIILLNEILLNCGKNSNSFCGEFITDLVSKYIGKKKPNYFIYYFGYTVDNPSYEFLKTKIFGDKSASNEKEETLYTVNLGKAKIFFENKIKNLKINELETVFKKLTKQFKFNVYEIADDLDVFVAFETMNNRGKKLSNLELLKNRLIYLSTKFNDDIGDKNRLRTDINMCWKTIYEYLGKNKNNILPDDVFLKNHWIMYHDYSREKGNDYIEDLLKERYIAKRITVKDIINPLTIEEINKYILSLKESVEHWYYLHNPEQAPYDDKIKILLDKLYRLNYGAFTPLLMAIFSREDNNYDIDEVYELLKLMEKYIFLIFKISQRRSNTGDSSFYGYARQYYKNELSVIDIIGIEYKENDKDWYGINGWLTKYFKLKSFYEYLADKFENREGYYSWNGLSYFLFEYELCFKDKAKNHTQEINWKSYLDSKENHITIEHIFPQTPSEKCWIDELTGLTDKEKKSIINSLGNLVPLSRAKNSKFQNHCFDIKKNGKNEEDFIAYKNGSYSEREIYDNYENNWGVKEIEDRGLKLLNFMAEHWDIEELKERKKQKEFLFI
ncbi:MAG: DUF262 domain-containing HNH endonuclease family protein [Aliarcobacter sp.]|nr:DUF262 domain-containing HNH endonuclease family protein [Aliarcobacter sp.]